jgi:hypothetical protein
VGEQGAEVHIQPVAGNPVAVRQLPKSNIIHNAYMQFSLEN